MTAKPKFGWTGLTSLALSIVAGCTSNTPLTIKPDEVRSIPVKTVTVVQTEVERTTLQPASVHAYYRAEIRAKASGYVKELKADIGEYVEAGAELALIDVPELQKRRAVIESRIRQMEAEERRSQAGTQLATARVRSSEAMLAEAKSQMSRAEASLAASEAEFSRTQDLVRRQSLENRMLDEVRMRRDSELANREAVLSSIESAAAEVAVAEAMLASAKADLEAARATTDITRRQLEELEVLVAYATVRAPFAGLVTDRQGEPGALVREENEVGAGAPLFVISQVDNVRVRIPVPESDAPHVSHGDQVTLTFPSFVGEPPIIGAVSRVSGSLDPSTRTMLVEADMPNPDRKLLPGMFGQASISLSTKVAANVLPARAVRFDDSGDAYVYAVGQDQTVSIIQVTMGMDNGNSIEILSGVEPGQRVIDAHLKRFANGQQVAVLSN